MTTNRYLPALLLAVVIVCVAAAVPRFAGIGADARKASIDSTSPREIRLVVRDMTFYIDGQTTPNPTLSARPGERIRLVLNNAEPGMSHDFAIDSWNVHTRLLKGKGQDSVEFTVPETRGSHAYRCTPHPEMMNGTIIVN
jgi:plastocyanin